MRDHYQHQQTQARPREETLKCVLVAKASATQWRPAHRGCGRRVHRHERRRGTPSLVSGLRSAGAARGNGSAWQPALTVPATRESSAASATLLETCAGVLRCSLHWLHATHGACKLPSFHAHTWALRAEH